MPTRVAVAAVVAIGLAVQASAAGAAQDWPNRPVTMVVPFPAGGSTDVVARALSPRLSEILGQQVIIENISGAGGMIGAARVAKAAPDGYQFVLGTTGTHAQNQTLYAHPLHNAASDFTPVGLIVQHVLVLVARKDLPADDLPQFIAYAKANQAKMQYGSAGAGSGTHLACALLNAAIGINVAHVPYRGGNLAMQDVIAGRIDYECPNSVAAIPQIESKLLKAIAVLSKNRSQVLPDLATAQEQGLEDFAADNWNALFVPRGTPGAIVARLHDAMVEALNTPAVQARLRDIGADPVAPERSSPEYLQDLVESDIKKWAAAIRLTGLTMN